MISSRFFPPVAPSFDTIVVLAPSGAGKTTLVQRLASPFVVDFDTVVRDTIGWPRGHWWLDPEIADATHRAVARLLADFVRSHPTDFVVFFNWDTTVPEARDVDRSVIVWLPYRSELLRNAEARRAAGVTNQPVDIAALDDNAANVYRYAIARGRPVLTTDQLLAGLAAQGFQPR